jgi:RNA ligase
MQKEFIWDDQTQVHEKVDGSLILVFHYRGEWIFTTRGSFGDGEINLSGRTWRDLVWSILDKSTVQLGCDPNCTHVMELVSPYNKVVRNYNGTFLYLLSIIQNETGIEKNVIEVDKCAVSLNIRRPKRFTLNDSNSILEFLKSNEKEDPTFEGFVAVDKNQNRVKFKSKTYVALHHLIDNGNICNPRKLVPLLLRGEKDEILAYVPELKEKIDEVQGVLDEHYNSLVELWRRTNTISDRKSLALAIKDHPFAGMIFKLRNDHAGEETEELLRAKWLSEVERITRKLYG